ncbi:MAG TPA: tetratricopeptide repeat protein [Saprospiraceae bacterium]|nr:tetratricopeptide repeat protein [Saprospiraceae bacterium]HNM25042.1 tetratricopeptide repeat protein [Saprospiraceae bacterium]
MKITPKHRFSLREPARRILQFGRQILVLTDIRRPENWLGTLVSLLLRLGTLSLIVFAVVLIWRLMKSDGYVIEAFTVPKVLEEAGFQGPVLARMAQDEFLKVKEIAASVKADSVNLQGDEAPELNVAVMGFGVSLRSVAFQLRELFGRPNNIIRGEVTLADSTLALTLRMTGFQPVMLFEKTADGLRPALNRLLRRAGEQALGNYDPYRLAIYLNRQQRQEEGIRVVGNMLGNRPQEAHWAYMAWGVLLEDQGKFDEALEKYEAALRFKPDFPLPWMRQAWLLQRTNRTPEALVKVEKALELLPGEPSYWNTYGNMLNQQKRYEEADRAFSKVSELTGPGTGWQINWAEAKLNRGDVEGGKQLLRQVMDHSSDEQTRTLARAFLAFVNDDQETASKAMLEAAALDPNNGIAVRTAQQACLLNRDYQRAIRLGTGIRFDSENSEQKQMILNLTSMAFYLTGQYDSAFVYANRAILVDSTAGYPYATLAEVHAMKGEHDDFFRYLEKAFQKGMRVTAIAGQEEPYDRYANSRRYRLLIAKYSRK